jgi:hypothetical protein
MTPKEAFLDLPREVRDSIYDEAWKSLDGICASTATKVVRFGFELNLWNSYGGYTSYWNDSAPQSRGPEKRELLR